MPILAPTPPDRMLDAKGRPYFLWDEDTRRPNLAIRHDHAAPMDRWTALAVRAGEQAQPQGVQTWLIQFEPFHCSTQAWGGVRRVDLVRELDKIGRASAQRSDRLP